MVMKGFLYLIRRLVEVDHFPSVGPDHFPGVGPDHFPGVGPDHFSSDVSKVPSDYFFHIRGSKAKGFGLWIVMSFACGCWIFRR